MTKNGDTLKYRIECLEKDMNDVTNCITLIRTNELPHLKEEIADLKGRVNLLIAIGVFSMFLNIGITWLLKN